MNEQNAPSAYPLAWPDGWPRVDPHRRSSGSIFKQAPAPGQFAKRPVTFHKAARLLHEELRRMRATGLVISTNARVKADGMVYADDAERRYQDPGVAIYFTLKGRAMVMAQDAYDTLAANLRSLGLAVEAMRQLERHGGGHMMERAFTGFSALPPPESARPAREWWQVMGYPSDPGDVIELEDVESRFRRLAKDRHPDVAGGSAEAMAELNLALERARQIYG